MEALKIRQTIEEDGELHLTGLPLHKGEKVELIVLHGGATEEPSHHTVQELLDSGLLGLWANRTDLGDSAVFARELRGRAAGS